MQNHTVSMGQRQFRIGDLANELKVKKFVVRFWEQEFNLAASRSEGGHRFYTVDDLHTFQTIKDLLYNQGYTIEGARKQLPIVLKERADARRAAEKAKHEAALAAQPLALPALPQAALPMPEPVHHAHSVVETPHTQVVAPATAVATLVPCTTCQQHARHIAMVKDELLQIKERLHRL
ncbi:MerR family transcriptional regulator [bacterium]|nr:MerR family transcriptional regulator [bacterium]